MKRVYISGPMTGLPNFNRDAFNHAEDQLRARGFDPLNPSSNGLADDAPYDEHMRADLRMLLTADMVATLPGWERSRGANIETRLASDLGMPVHPLTDYITSPPTRGGCASRSCSCSCTKGVGRA